MPDDGDDGVVDLVQVRRSKFQIEVEGPPIKVDQTEWYDQDEGVLHITRSAHLPRPLSYITINLVNDGKSTELERAEVSEASGSETPEEVEE